MSLSEYEHIIDQVAAVQRQTTVQGAKESHLSEKSIAANSRLVSNMLIV